MRERTLDDKAMAALQPSVSLDLPPAPPVEVLPPDASLPPLPPNETSAANNADSDDPASNNLAVSEASSSSRCSPLQASPVSSKEDALCTGSKQLSLEPQPPSWDAVGRPSDVGSLEFPHEPPLIVEARPPTRQSYISAPRVERSSSSATTGQVVQQEDGDRLRLGYKSFMPPRPSHPQRDHRTAAVPSLEDDSLLTSSLEPQEERLPSSQQVVPSSTRSDVAEQADSDAEHCDDGTKQCNARAHEVASTVPEQLRLSLSTGANFNPRAASPATDDEELVLDGGDSVLANTIQDLGDDPVLRAHQQIVDEEQRGALSTTLQNDEDVLAAAAKVDLRAAVAKYDAKNSADAQTNPKQRPTGWAATFDIASSGDVFATRDAVPHPPALRNTTDRDARLEKMQRFNMMRAKKTRAMAERRRLEKEHRAALRAGGFGVDEDDENNGDLAPQAPNAVKAAIRRASTQKPSSTRPLPTTRSMSNRRNVSNVRCGAIHVLSLFCAGPRASVPGWTALRDDARRRPGFTRARARRQLRHCPQGRLPHLPGPVRPPARPSCDELRRSIRRCRENFRPRPGPLRRGHSRLLSEVQLRVARIHGASRQVLHAHNGRRRFAEHPIQSSAFAYLLVGLAIVDPMWEKGVYYIRKVEQGWQPLIGVAHAARARVSPVFVTLDFN